MRWLSILGLFGYLALEAPGVAAPMANARVDANSVWLRAETDSTHPDENYQITLSARGDKDLRAVRLWVKRAATPDFAGASWEEVPLQDVKATRGVNEVVKIATIANASQRGKYLAVKGEIELARYKSIERLASQTLLLPEIQLGTLSKAPEGSREFYARASEPAQSLHLWVARSATRDFANANWREAPATIDEGKNYRTQILTATPQMPWVAAYSTAEFGATAVRASSPQLIWNGLPFPKNPAEIDGKTCPLHGTTAGVVPIVYGMPVYSDPNVAIQGGCIVGPGSPAWHCNLCNCSWGDFMAQKTKS